MRGRRSKAANFSVGCAVGAPVHYSCTSAIITDTHTVPGRRGHSVGPKLAMSYTVPRVFDRLNAVQLTASVVHARRSVELEKKKGIA